MLMKIGWYERMGSFIGDKRREEEKATYRLLLYSSFLGDVPTKSKSFVVIVGGDLLRFHIVHDSESTKLASNTAK